MDSFRKPRYAHSQDAGRFVAGDSGQITAKLFGLVSRLTSMSSRARTNHRVAVAIVGLIAAYLITLAFGFPQYATALINESHHAASGHAAAEGQATADGAHQDSPPGSSAANHSGVSAPPIWTVIPFILLLGAIAVLPLISATEHWWEHNRNRFLVAAGLATVTMVYYLLLHHGGIDGHWPTHHTVDAAEGLNWHLAWTIFANGILNEFIPFIVLLFSLYVISGGIRIEGDLQANPLTNASFMGVGGFLASFIGTTGAAMLLIRPLLETNSERRNVRHTVIFFIFIVCNCGGCLLPIGDPPLFLGYLRGVDFLWTASLWPQWLFVNGILLLVYSLLDQFVYYPRESLKDIRRDVTQTRRLKISGWHINVPLLLGVVLAVAFLDPSKAFPGTGWHAPLYLREIVQLGLVGISLLGGAVWIRDANKFNFHAILEVAALFCGIFICMQPALQILHENGKELGLSTPVEFFWVTGVLSSVLDNAPTYVVFFETAAVESVEAVAQGADQMAGVVPNLLTAISLGAVFMGAMTYIGNGPNFMVKAIAEESGVKMPSFFGYMAYSMAFLLPVLLLMNWRYLL